MKQKLSENYFEKIPLRSDNLKWTSDAEGMVTLEIENKGMFNTVAQKLFKKPRISYVHLDKIGSVVWPMLDGGKTVKLIGEVVELKLGEEAKPLYERLIKYFQILESYKFITWK